MKMRTREAKTLSAREQSALAFVRDGYMRSKLRRVGHSPVDGAVVLFFEDWTAVMVEQDSAEEPWVVDEWDRLLDEIDDEFGTVNVRAVFG